MYIRYIFLIWISIFYYFIILTSKIAKTHNNLAKKFGVKMLILKIYAMYL
jgi:hypothetical protein